MKSSKSKRVRIIITIILLFFICFSSHVMLLYNNIYGEWKQSGGCDAVPDFLYIEANKEINQIIFLKGLIYKEGEKYAIPLLCTRNTMIICCLHEFGWGAYSKKGEYGKVMNN